MPTALGGAGVDRHQHGLVGFARAGAAAAVVVLQELCMTGAFLADLELGGTFVQELDLAGTFLAQQVLAGTFLADVDLTGSFLTELELVGLTQECED